jgi:hypothetical protein
MEGVTNVWVGLVFAVAVDGSEIGGEGGVDSRVSDTPEDVVLAGGVSNEVSVVVGDNSERGDADTAAD